MISSGTDRRALSSTRATPNTRGCGAVLRAATKATTSENTTAMAVPAMLIASVSINGRIQLR
ncbi:hypothetical protein [Pseudomonas aeruginosa]|uniref:hypothetical protein n=1 Tax=Pseudomonas aeruginosa TaxID=287 RepID=UPI003D9A0EE6